MIASKHSYSIHPFIGERKAHQVGARWHGLPLPRLQKAYAWKMWGPEMDERLKNNSNWFNKKRRHPSLEDGISLWILSARNKWRFIVMVHLLNRGIMKTKAYCIWTIWLFKWVMLLIPWRGGTKVCREPNLYREPFSAKKSLCRQSPPDVPRGKTLSCGGCLALGKLCLWRVFSFCRGLLLAICCVCQVVPVDERPSRHMLLCRVSVIWLSAKSLAPGVYENSSSASTSSNMGTDMCSVKTT